MIPGRCVDIQVHELSILILSFIIDVVIMLLPLPVIQNLHVRGSRKALLTGMFLCGYG